MFKACMSVPSAFCTEKILRAIEFISGIYFFVPVAVVHLVKANNANPLMPTVDLLPSFR